MNNSMWKKMMGMVAGASVLPEYCFDKFFAFFYRRAMGMCGRNVLLKPYTSVYKGIENFYISDQVRIARYAVIYSTRARMVIGPKVDIAPCLRIITGNHRFDKVGYFMFDGDYEKKPEDDRDVIIEGDSWFGVGVTVLSGVTIGRGCILAAGSVVTRPMPPYSIIGGVPAKVLKRRFTEEEILEHEAKLYPIEKRMTREQVRGILSDDWKQVEYPMLVS